MSRLDDAIEKLYASFADIPHPQSIEECHVCCMCYVDTKTLLKVKVREAPLKELGSYGQYAMSTMGSKDDYLYFLPRILHLNCYG